MVHCLQFKHSDIAAYRILKETQQKQINIDVSSRKIVLSQRLIYSHIQSNLNIRNRHKELLVITKQTSNSIAIKTV